MLADSTKKTYKSHIRCYLTFCIEHDLPALPASSINLGRFVAYLNLTRGASSIQQHLSAIRWLHLEFDLQHPLMDNHHVTSLIKAVKRDKGCEPRYKLTLSSNHLLSMKSHLDLTKPADAQLWSIILTCFYGLLRISNVTVPTISAVNDVKSITRKDIEFHPNGTILNIHWTKTLQFRQRVLQTALPLLNSALCPTAALIHFISLAGNVPADAPAWTYIDATGVPRPPTPSSIRSRLQDLFAAVGLPMTDFNTHSLRRSGASHLLAASVPVDVIKVIGDWRSDSVLRYLKPDSLQKLSLVNSSFQK